MRSFSTRPLNVNNNKAKLSVNDSTLPKTTYNSDSTDLVLYTNLMFELVLMTRYNQKQMRSSDLEPISQKIQPGAV